MGCIRPLQCDRSGSSIHTFNFAPDPFGVCADQVRPAPSLNSHQVGKKNIGLQLAWRHWAKRVSIRTPDGLPNRSAIGSRMVFPCGWNDRKSLALKN